MKIVVYNSNKQSALSRKQIEIVKSTLPKSYFDRIQEFHICIDRDARCVEPLEYSEENKRVLFGFPVDKKTPENLSEAVVSLLIGLARIRSRSRFFLPLRNIEMKEYEPFVDEWKERILDEFQHRA